MAVSAVFCSSSSSSSAASNHKRHPFLAAPRPPLILRSAAAAAAAAVSASADKTHCLSLFPSSAFNTTLTPTANPRSLVVVKAARADQNSKRNSIVCADCDANGAIQCTQCKGTGVNSVDHFNGQFKAGALCWLCRGKREILCGNCNGAGFLGGFLSTQDD